MELIVIGLVAGFSYLSYSMWRRTRQGNGEGLDRALAEERTRARITDGERTLENLRPGDIVSHLTTDYIVEGVLALDNEGKVTRLYRIADAGKIRWLSFRTLEDAALFLDEVVDLPAGVNGSEQLTHRGLDYHLKSRFRSRVARTGAVGEGRLGERAWLYEYAGQGERCLVALGWEERTDGFLGEPVAPSLLEILPGAS